MNLRLAKKEDSKTLFDWRNEESVCLQSINTEPIPWETHTTWFERSLMNPNRQIYLAEVDGEAVGMIRWDKDEEKDYHELSWLLGLEFRGKGYSKQMLGLIIDQNLGRLYAQIKKDNVPSLAMVRSFGFKCVSPEGAPLTEWVLDK